MWTMPTSSPRNGARRGSRCPGPRTSTTASTRASTSTRTGTRSGSDRRCGSRRTDAALPAVGQPGALGPQVALLRKAEGPAGRGLVAVAGRRPVPGHLQQVPANRGQTVVPGDPLVGFEAVQQVQPGPRALV